MSVTEATSPQPVGRAIRGPAAVGGEWRRLLHLTRLLAVTEFRLRFFGSVLGYLWQVMHPLFLFGVLYVVFTEVVRLGGGVRFYPVALLAGVVLFVFLSESTSQSVQSLIEREPIVRKIQFPRLAVPLSIVLTALFRLALNLLVVFVFLLISGGGVRLSWLELPVLLALMVVLAAGLAALLSALFVHFRDVKPIWDVLLQVMFYATPIFYPITIVKSETLRELLMLNPFAAILQEFRHAVIDASHPSAADAIGGGIRLLIPLGLIALIAVVGFRYFDRKAPRIAEEL
ncbi:MAG: ABC transporter permease [Thermoleophilaceae bacterium]